MLALPPPGKATHMALRGAGWPQHISVKHCRQAPPPPSECYKSLAAFQARWPRQCTVLAPPALLTCMPH